ncbi:HlyC/CorC family transporter [Candidatus Peregrinibacteria bacterium]|nr:HlyC/CorC family transporter [Candidatus Peregrinibacteria bacterium]
MDGYLIALICLIALSAIFSGAEIALTSLSSAKIYTLRKDGKFASSVIIRLKKKPENALIAILIGNNLANILATVVATLWGIRFFGNHAIGVVTGVLTFIILIFGEITPKTLAQKYAESFARAVAYPLLGMVYLFFPVVWILHRFIRGLMRLFKAKNPILTTSEEELLAMVDIGKQEGVIEEHEQEMIENVLEFTDTSAEEIMTTAKNIKALEIHTTITEAVRFFMKHGHSRIPVYEDGLNNIAGIINVHNILRLLSRKKRPKTLAEIKYEKPLITPKTKAISKLFRDFQRRRQHMAIVVDEHGQTIGLVTLEDILEEIVGDITDEHDKDIRTIRLLGKNRWEADGETTIEEINKTLGIELNFAPNATISLLILKKLNRFPKEKEKILYENMLIKIREMGKKKIEKVVLSKKRQAKTSLQSP